MLETIDAAAVRRWCAAGLDGLAHAREEIDALNVFPVPDGDTGTNLYLTVEAASEALHELPDDAPLPHTVKTLAHGALMGARGNSGVILSQLLRGIAVTFERPGSVDALRLVQALQRSADLAYAAVAKPVEGTMLTVARAAADAANLENGDLRSVVRAAALGAREALAHTPEQLEPLARAGVVDAGGRGLCVLYDALLAVVTGRASVTPARARVPAPRAHTVEDWPAGPAYEVMYLIDSQDDAISGLKSALGLLGDSLLVVGGDGLWNVHVHVDDVGAAIEAGVEAGRPHRIRVTHFADGPARSEAADELGERGLVTVVAGQGLATLFETAGATVVRGGPGRRASTAELLDGIHRARAREVVVLPNDSDSLSVAEAAAAQARAEGLRVAVIPTKATVQALAAVAVHEPGRRFDEDVVHMTAAAVHTRHGGVTVAAREAMTMAGPCQPGDVLGIVDGDFAVIGDDLAKTACDVVDRMLGGGGELVTLVTGADAQAGLADEVVAHIAATRREVDAVVYDGGQPRYPLLIGVE